jgi:two-component system cell cycle sensor histidine kinase/response regulator CckA
MNDQARKNPKRIEEISVMKQRIKELERSEAELKRAEEEKRRNQDIAERLAEEMAVIAKIGRLVGSTLDIDQVYERFAAEARKLIPFDRLTVNLNNHDQNTITVAYVFGSNVPGRSPGDSFPLQGSVNETLERSRTGMLLHLTNIDDLKGQYVYLVSTFQEGIRSFMGVPLISRDKVIGVLHFRSKKPDTYREQDLRLAERIGAQIAGAIANAQLYKELKKTEMSLRESGQRYRLLVENADEAIIVIQDGMAKFVNRGAEWSGYSEEEYLSMPFLDIIHPEDRDMVRERYRQKMNGETTATRHAYRTIHKSGRIRWIEVGSVLIEWEGRPATLNLITDITERKRTEEALRESEEIYRSLIENANEAILVAQDGWLVFFNRLTTGMIGYSGEELISRPFIEFIHPDDRDMVIDRHVRRMKGEEIPRIYSFRIVCRDGDAKWVELNAVVINWKGKPATLNFISDITERRQIEEEKRILEERLQRADKMEAIGTLAGGIAHDFNNLLMGIQGYASLTLLDLDPSHPHYEQLRRIEEQVQSGADLTRQLLGFARGGRYEVKASDMNDIIKKTSSMFGRTKKEISIHRKYGKGLRSVEVDQGQMEQVFMNLYVNAWQAMPGGGKIYLETEDVLWDEAQAFPHAVKPGKYVKITVTDTGTGMDEKTRERIFDPFFTTKEMGRGTGLGLATVYGIIKGHKGAINVYSEPGHGTTFTIYLPASEKEVVKEKTATGTIARGTETILLVDDEKMVLDVNKELLKSMGYRVYAAGSGQGALAVYMEKRNEIDLVILDMIMPGISGGETFDRLREINPDAKIILSSGYSLTGEAQTIMDRGCNGFLQKPFQLSDLSRKVREMLD